MKISQRKAGTILSYVNIFVKVLISFIYTPTMIRFLGDAEFGVYNLSHSVVSYLGLLSLGFGGAYVRFYYIYKTKKDDKGVAKLNGLFILLYTIISMISLIAGYFLVNNISFILQGELNQSEIALSANLMKILIINIALTFPASVFESYVTATENFIFQRVLILVRSFLNPLIGIPLLLMGYKSIGLSVAITLATVISLIANMYYSIKKLKMKFLIKNPDFKLFREIAVFSSYIFMNMLIDQLNWNVDKLIIGKVVGSVAVAVYSLGAQINNYFMQFSTSVSGVFIPKINEMIQSGKEDNQLTYLFTRIGRIQYYILMLILTGIIGVGKYFIINIWVGKSYNDSFFIALILIIPMIIPLIQNIGIEIQKAKNMHKFRSVIYLLIAILNLIISIPLAKKYGAIGSAIGTTIGIIIGNGFIMNIYYHFRVGLNMKYFWKSIGKASVGMIIPVILAIIIANIDINNLFQFMFYGILIVSVYILSVWKFSLNEYEKDLIKKPLKLFLGRKQ